jgi:hypothetical protein
MTCVLPRSSSPSCQDMLYLTQTVARSIILHTPCSRKRHRTHSPLDCPWRVLSFREGSLGPTSPHCDDWQFLITESGFIADNVGQKIIFDRNLSHHFRTWCSMLNVIIWFEICSTSETTACWQFSTLSAEEWRVSTWLARLVDFRGRPELLPLHRKPLCVSCFYQA